MAPDLGRDADTPVSRFELLELLARRRFEDPNWFVRLQAMSQENLLRELVTLQAVSLVLDWQRYRTDERRGAFDAAALALGVEEMRRLAKSRPNVPRPREALWRAAISRTLIAETCLNAANESAALAGDDPCV